MMAPCRRTLRHATPTMTLGTYAQAVTVDRHAAQNKLAALLKLETGAARAISA